MQTLPDFAARLLAWHAGIRRPMPWRLSRDPYRIWLSEMLLQQTRVEQALPYYERFVQHFPTVQDLAAAEPEQVLKLWEGLGYYARARNLHAAAKYVWERLCGVFPPDYDALLQLPGVGVYTAAAVASLAFGLPRAVVDGNVYRVLARLFGIDTPIDGGAGKAQFARLAQELLDAERPGDYNQALMDFGAVHCTPAAPLCAGCPFAADCQALQQNRVRQLPVKAKKIQKKQRYFYYIIQHCQGKVQLRKRLRKDVWLHLYDFPCLELPYLVPVEQFLQSQALADYLPPKTYTLLRFSPKPLSQTLSHQHIKAFFVEVQLLQGFFEQGAEFLTVEREKIPNFAFPRIVLDYLNQTNFLEI